MKVYAEYIKENGKEYRRKTLLQFGDSTELIGSTVLMNPGSAEPKGEADSKFINSFYEQNHQEKVDLKDWKMFGVDSTMKQLEKVFNGSYIGENKNLNGVIQLFNCFYYKDQNSDRANKSFDEKSKFNFNESKYFLDKPVYFGWGGVGKFRELKPIATKIFSEYKTENNHIYDSEFMDNCFYHPGYLNRSHNINIKTKEINAKFFLWLNEGVDKAKKDYSIYISETLKSSKPLDEDYIKKLQKLFNDSDEFKEIKKSGQTIRYEIDEYLELTITHAEEGYWGVRTLDPKNRDKNVKGGWIHKEFFKNYSVENEDELFERIKENLFEIKIKHLRVM